MQAPAPAAAPDACVQQIGANPSVLRVALTQPVDVAHAPVPRNASERLLFRQLYETLVTLDCNGAVVPQLAESWSIQGNTWEFRLRANARFTDGSPVTAQDVVASWAARSLPRIVTGISASGEHALRVVVSAAFDVAIFAGPAFAIAHGVSEAGWPSGTTTFQAAPDSLIRLRSVDGREIAFELTGTDERSALDLGVDVLITRDGATLAYARALPEYRVTELPWSRTYVLANHAAPAGDRMALHGLLRDAVPAETRPPQTSYWWQQQTCTNAMAMPNTRSIGYPKNDATARALAERLTSLAWQRNQTPNGFVLSIPNTPDCSTALPQTQVTPLLETRDYLIHRANIGRIRVFGDGTIEFEGGRP